MRFTWRWGHQPYPLTLWLYMVPLYFIAGVICLLCALPFTNPIKTYTTLNVVMIVGWA